MIIIKHKSSANSVKFPKNSQENNQNLTLLLKSELTLKTYRFDNLTDKGDLYEFYVIDLNLTDVVDGEYIYTLSNDKVQNIGLMRVGKLNDHTIKEYDKKEEIKEYRY